ncbi:hypothetical protein TSTA_041450 [Talaromyces stipitatus ATCC 10500]|uniref:Uncharacterized protein n=1 Tax=Talaromyces stipitatus (strain ATCC 10500 / CBS 375.48 / QM 6759 / NRRL 1006) TaxID=441959 RepID=B8MJ78_TALSN|nr:uncharacterized protein TSTA_041450 [Talaromyces stipitatus ATCC 10500]EED14667.1 hypothetical protein TSTA_041450 [Talaromyces stipitatus ATCC 10500]
MMIFYLELGVARLLKVVSGISILLVLNNTDRLRYPINKLKRSKTERPNIGSPQHSSRQKVTSKVNVKIERKDDQKPDLAPPEKKDFKFAILFYSQDEADQWNPPHLFRTLRYLAPGSYYTTRTLQEAWTPFFRDNSRKDWTPDNEQPSVFHSRSYLYGILREVFGPGY